MVRGEESQPDKLVNHESKESTVYQDQAAAAYKPGAGYKPASPKDSLDGLFELDRTGNGKLSLAEINFEARTQDEESKRGSWPPSPSPPKYEYSLSELHRLQKNFNQLAGPDGQLSREEVLSYRRDLEALPPVFNHADTNDDLKLDEKELQRMLDNPTWTRDFDIYNTFAHVNHNFDAAAGRDGKITSAEWAQYLKNHPVGD